MSVPDSQDPKEWDLKLLDDLKNYIIMGPDFMWKVEELLNTLQSEDKTGLLTKHDDGQSLLQLAAISHGDVTLMEKLGSLCPDLLTEVRGGRYEGQNVLHILVSKQNVEGACAILGHPCLRKYQKKRLLRGVAVGPIFSGTVMMGQLPLSVAALTFNLRMVDALLDAKAKMHAVDAEGNTVLHSLVHFAGLYKSKEGEVAVMIQEIHKRLQDRHSKKEFFSQSVWKIENKKGLTVLKLAATLVLPSLFQLILQLKGVYCQLDCHDGLFDSLEYDVTEIDPVARQQWMKAKEPPPEPKRFKVTPFTAEDDLDTPHFVSGEDACCPGLGSSSAYDVMRSTRKKEPKRKALSVLEIICQWGRADTALDIFRASVIIIILREKWVHYRIWYWLWFVSHFFLMCFLSAHAVFKAKLIKEAEEATANRSSTTTSQTEEDFVKGMSGIAFVAGLWLVAWEVFRLYRERGFNVPMFHHNMLYRILLIVLALALIADSVWYWACGPVNNFFLTLALLVGAWFCTFFLRPWKSFSFFTIMILKVLSGDMFRFFVIISLVLLVFSVAMHIAYLATPGPCPGDFENLWETILTLFKLGLGLGEVSVLREASHPWLTTLLFILFVVLTYLLLLNALIAMMSTTCSLVAKNELQCWNLERMSVILLLESTWPVNFWLYNSGELKEVATYDMEKKHVVWEDRYFKKISALTASSTDSASAVSRQSPIKRALSFDNSPAPNNQKSKGERDLLASFVDQYRALAGLVKDRGRPEADNKQNESKKVGDDTKGQPLEGNRGSSGSSLKSERTPSFPVSRQHSSKSQLEMPPPEVYHIPHATMKI